MIELIAIVVVTVVAVLLIIKHNQKGAAVVEDDVQAAADKAKAAVDPALTKVGTVIATEVKAVEKKL